MMQSEAIKLIKKAIQRGKQYKNEIEGIGKNGIALLSDHVMLDSLCYVLIVGCLIAPLGIWLIVPQWTISYWVVVIVAFGIFPLIDLLMPRDPKNLTEQKLKERKQHEIYKILPLMYPMVQTCIMIWALDHYVKTVQYMGTLAKVGYYSSIGVITSAVGVNIAHELFHKREKHEKAAGIYLLFMMCYSHFYVEHIWGHHKHVGTPEDAATAKRYETQYTFIPKSIWAGLKSSYNIEKKRCTVTGQKWYRNRIIQFEAIQVLICWVIYEWFGKAGLVAFLSQSLVSIILIEGVNYIEHYGLARRAVKKGDKTIYEPVNILHSWNATEVVTNYLLLKLQRHSDHHAYPTKPYQTLSSYDLSPQLPTGYPGMILLSFLPPLFFYIMHPLLDAQYKKLDDISAIRVNQRTNQLTITAKTPSKQ